MPTQVNSFHDLVLYGMAWLGILGWGGKECCCRIAAITTTDWAVLGRLTRYSSKQPGAMCHVPGQDARAK
eukprot:1169142-Alexandrium_andersonii.AAC.1